MSGRDVHGPDWRDEWDDPRWSRGSGSVYGCGFWAVAILAALLFLGAWLFSPPARADDWQRVPIGRCVGPAVAALILGEGASLRLYSNGVSEYRRKGAPGAVQLRWRERGRCLDAWRVIEERGA